MKRVTKETQPRSQGLSSSLPRDVKRKDPGTEVEKNFERDARAETLPTFFEFKEARDLKGF